jgi:hypothetical protein
LAGAFDGGLERGGAAFEVITRDVGVELWAIKPFVGMTTVS